MDSPTIAKIAIAYFNGQGCGTRAATTKITGRAEKIEKVELAPPEAPQQLR